MPHANEIVTAGGKMPSCEFNRYLISIFLKRFYLFIHERHTERERGRDLSRGRSRLHAGSPKWDLIRELQDHALSQYQALNLWATQGSPPSSLYRCFPEDTSLTYYFSFFFFLFIYDSHHRERERGRDIGRGRSRLHAPGARRGIRSWVSRTAPWAKGRR